MHLFAIIAKVDGITNSGRDIVESFLKQQLNIELVEQYLKLFDEFMEQHHSTSDTAKKRKRTSANSVKVLMICTQINAELTQRQKIVVLIRLIEFINSSGEVSEQELEFVQTVSSTFNVEEAEFQSLLSFVNNNETTIADSADILIINNQKDRIHTRSKHILVDTLSGEIRVLSVHSVNMYVLRYFGTSDLYLNGQPLNPNKVHLLTQGSTIRSSKVSPIYYSDIISRFLQDTSSAKIIFQTKDIEFKFKSGKIGLNKLNLYEESGTMIGIMGGSGAGKSTLLNILNGIDAPSAGEVLINGINIHTEKDKIEGVIGFVSQDDLLIEELTVFQNLFYSSKLCFDKLSDEEITKKVDDILLSLGLDATRDLKVGSPLEKTISGGQRKRLNIALELIREPSVMFVDEPTSGLSSRDSENIMDLLKELALKGKLVFVVIHQPSSDIYKMFDKLLILDLGGYPIYNGNPVEGVIYFKQLINHVNANESECPSCGNVNPEQIFNIIETKVLNEYGEPTQLRKVSPKEWNGFYKEKLEPAQIKSDPEKYTEIPPSIFKIPNKLKQFFVFMTRDVKSKLTNTQYLVINLLEAPVLAFILAFLVKFYNSDVTNKIGYIYRENENMPAFIFMSVVVALFIGLTVSAEEIIRDRKILKRERFLNLSKGSYIYSKITIMFVLSAIQSFTFVMIGNSILQLHGMYFDYWFILFTASCFANMLGLNISSSFNSAVTIYILIPFLIIPQLLLSGVIVKFEKLNPAITSQNKVPLVGEMMASRWAFEALAVNQFKKNNYEKQLYPVEKSISFADFKKTFWVSEMVAKVDKCENALKNPTKKEELTYDLNMLKNELNKEALISNQKFDSIDKLTPESFNPTISADLKKFLNEVIKKRYITISNNNNDKRDKIVNQMIKDAGGQENFQKLKDENDNENLSDMLKNRSEAKKIFEFNGEFIQRDAPIFLDPSKNSFVSAHFYAPRKVLFGKYYDTYWVNAMVIWSMSFVLAFTLYFDLLRKLIEGIENIAFVIKKKMAKK